MAIPEELIEPGPHSTSTRFLPHTTPVTSYFSWGRHPLASHRGAVKPAWADELQRFDSAGAPVLAVGLGRSYGDSCLNDGGYLVDINGMDHVLAFNREQGLIRCAAGVSLDGILKVAVPAGWFLPVTPGTKFVTIAGAIANDVHGKNHHCAGTIGCHVTRFELLRSDGARLLCSPTENAELFSATIGGLGLTGIILWAELRLKKIASSKIAVDTLTFRSLSQFLDITAESEQRGFEYTVAWIDCLSGTNARGIFYRGNHAESGALKTHKASGGGPRVPFAFPELALNRVTISVFNALFYAAGAMKRGTQLVDYDPFFYPLDAVRDWNLIYGKRGLTQYQCVIPESESVAFQKILSAISDSGLGSFLGVIKKFGAMPSPGLMSFPRPGLTLALDFPFRGEPTMRLFEQLDRIVFDAHGALYPAKDCRMSRRMFEVSYPNLERFRPSVDPHLSSGFWRRIQEEIA
jgi:FAD/FMN-containing dehydrogenase